MMATTEAAFSSSTQTLPCFNSNLLKSDPKYWNGAHVLASTESFFDDDPEEKIKKKVLASKSQFHMGRTLTIKHLPRDVTEAEVRELLSDFPVQSVTVTAGPGSGIARAELEDPEMLEDWDTDRTFLLRGQNILVSASPTENLLCVARLPFDFTEEQFQTLVMSAGQVKRFFLMTSSRTGESKGYGFVEYVTPDISKKARAILDGKKINGWTLVCDLVDPQIVKLDRLHSTCLYVDNLPKDFRDMSEFRKIFSTVVNPPYCQIALKNGCPQDWGLVEYSTPEDAETAQTLLNGYNLRGHNIRVSYYIPGVRAINLYITQLNESEPKGRSAGLLPEPSGQAIMQNLQNLFKQNPIFAQNLQSIIASQIQAAQNGELPSESQRKGPSPPGPTHDQNRKLMFSPSGMPELCKSPNVPPPPPPTNGLHSSPPGHSPTQFLKPTPPLPTKMPLLLNPSMPPPPPARRLSTSPPTGEVAPPLPGSAPLDDEANPSYWAGLLGQLRGVPPAPVSPYPVPPPEPSYNMPPPNLAGPNIPVELQQSLVTLLSNPQSLQQILSGLHSLSQSPSVSSAPVPPPGFPYMQGGVDPSWALTSTVAQPMPHLARSLLTSPIPMAMSPKPGPHIYPTWAPTFLPPNPQPMFTPFGSPGIIWSQASPIMSPQPNPMMTPIGQKRRLLPSPEPSPEGNYIGQHSQGIGGHYADSYFKRKKKN